MTPAEPEAHPDPRAERDPAFVAGILQRFVPMIPHAQALGIVDVRAEDYAVLARLPMRPEFVGDVERGIVHTGIVTSLIDSLCGLAVFVRIGQRDSIATLDLRVDYLGASWLGADLHCRAECYRLTSQIAFTRATVWQDDEARPVATSVAAFMRGTGEKARFA